MKTLPLSPQPAYDESLSSWVERIALFYGAEYEHWLATLPCGDGYLRSPWESDTDCDEALRVQLAQSTGLALSDVPRVLPSAAGIALPLHARYTYCSHCWNDDVAAGNQPYVRRRWSYWRCVHCQSHHRLLDARLPGPRDKPRTNAWAWLWRQNPRWASAFDLRSDPNMSASFTTTYTLNEQLRVDGREHGALMRALNGVTYEDTPSFADDARWLSRLLDLASMPAFSLIVDRVRVALLPKARDGELASESDIPSTRATVKTSLPLLIENRLAILMTALELRSMILAGRPLLPRLSLVVRTAALKNRIFEEPRVKLRLLGWHAGARDQLQAAWPRLQDNFRETEDVQPAGIVSGWRITRSSGGS